MRVIFNRLYSNDKLEQGNIISLPIENSFYLDKVMRLKIGDKFKIFNKQDGEFFCVVREKNKSKLLIEIEDKTKEVQKEPPLLLALCLIKPDKFIEAINSAVQIGVTGIIPVISSRCNIRKINYERCNKVLIEATEQSGRFIPPLLYKTINIDNLHLFVFDEILKDKQEKSLIYADETMQNYIKKTDIEHINLLPKNNCLNSCILIGPEGGFSEEERNLLIAQKNTYRVSLGQNILRAETAVTYALTSIINKLLYSHE